MTSYQIVYILSRPQFRNGIVNIIPFVASYNHTTAIRLEKKALREVIESFDIDLSNTVHEGILKMCEEISDNNLLKIFKPKSKKKQDTIEALTAYDERLLIEIRRWVDRRLNKILSLISENNLSLFDEPKRSTDLATYTILIKDQVLKPVLNFDKTAIGIKYKLILNDGSCMYRPCDQDVSVLCNSPGWILLNKSLYRLEAINANKLIPFIKKEEIFIPNKLRKEYFTKFVFDLIGRVDVTTSGFDIMEHTPPPKALIRFSYDFINHRHVLVLDFEYEGVFFRYGENSKSRSKLLIGVDDKISVLKTIRNDRLENEIVERIKKIGLKVSESKNFYFDDLIEELDFFNRIAEYRRELEDYGFSIEIPVVEEKEFTLETGEIEVISSTLNGDWFDIHMEVKIGGEVINFIHFVPFIKAENRLFPLRSGKYFVIPQEWVKKYSSLSALSELNGEKLKLKKTLQNILDKATGDTIRRSTKDEITFAVPSEITAQLRPYQVDGASWIATHLCNGLGVCLADDMGLGKTLQTIAALIFVFNKLYKTNDIDLCQGKQVQLSLFDNTPPWPGKRIYVNALVIVPASLSFNWHHEISKFAPNMRVLKYVGDKEERRLQRRMIMEYDFVITTYNYLLSDLEEVKSLPFRFLVLDESQRIKNNQSKIFRAINSLEIKHRISLSGTPIENSLKDLWSQMQFINPDLLGSFEFFKKRYLQPIEKSKDSYAVEELKTIVRPYLMRRSKKEVLIELPECIEQVYMCEMTTEHAKLYEEQKSAARNEILQLNEDSPQTRFHILSALSKLRLLANHPRLFDESLDLRSSKFAEVLDFLNTIIKSESKVLIFSSFVKHLSLFAEYFEIEKIPFVQLTGQESKERREEAVHHFTSNDRVKVFLISLKAGGVGLNLTAADNVIILDPWWNPFAEMQAIGRAHRIGQQNKVLVTRFITKNTIEEKILTLQSEKISTADDILSDDIPRELSIEDLKRLI